ncbi:hypothetical protein IV494_00120 [Kaistella sp. G5-32]|uniref:Uncharacterized protein n=1 Tax=Kaistella gelatinilytica TaxID=2787636 RepID=A0ABS0F796_9FLAO|nr:hypothetical protein [Kaistella gelatinilytica]MBF8455573.1 hypothetical protein [Kaistella gelatinilytica]
MKNIEDCRKKLEMAYNKVGKMISDNKFEEYKAVISRRENNMAASMYLSKSKSEERVNDLLNDFNSGFKVKPIAEDSIMFLYGQNKVAMLKKPNGESALYLENAETEEELMLDISFFIPEGKTEFEII